MSNVSNASMLEDIAEEDAATIPSEQVPPPVDTAQGIRESIAGLDPATRADALRGLGPGFLGEDFYNQYNPDGTLRGGKPTPTPTPTPIPDLTPSDPNAAGRRESARQIVKSFLSKYNISGLDDSINNILNDGIEDSNAVLFMLRDTPEFQKRFAANRKRKESGFAELDFATYIGMENAYRETMQAFGLPEGFYNDQRDFEKLIEGDVSVAELTNRIRDGFVKVRDADPAVRQQMFELYGVTESDLAAYFIDPQRSRPLMMAQDYKKQAAAASIAARGVEQGDLQLSKEEAESLVGRGFTPEQARAQFTQRRQLAGLFEEMGGEESLTRQQKLGATFGYDVESQMKLERRRDLRLGEFRGGGGFARTSGATSGTVETGVGTAQ